MMKDVFVVTIDSFPFGIKDDDTETYLFGIFPSEEAANLAIKEARENCPYDAFKRDWVFDTIRIYRAPFGKAMEITFAENDAYPSSAIADTDVCLA